MKVFVCGGRKFHEPNWVTEILDKLHKDFGISHIIHRNSFWIDDCVGRWATKNYIQTDSFRANTARYGKEAYLHRNNMIIRARPDLILVFPGEGTRDIIKKARREKIKFVIIEDLFDDERK